MHPPHGPLKVGANRQITIPAELLARMSLQPGDSVYVALSDEIEGALVVVPVERVVTWIDAGRSVAASSEGQHRPRRQDLRSKDD